ncbi:MAG: RnfABCDGE type electron transport complex subunit B, partial [Burkholderiales bacterium]
CLPPCPVDCIAMVESGEAWTHEVRLARAAQYRRRYRARMERLERTRALQSSTGRKMARARGKQATIARVVERARKRLRDR